MAIISLVACRQQERNDLQFVNNYEQAKGWMHVLLEPGVAHSGRYSEKLVPGREFSHTFILPLAAVDRMPVQQAEATVWINAIELKTPLYLVMDVVSPDDKQHYRSVYVDATPLQSGKKGWTKITARLDLKGLPVTEPLIFKSFVWNNGNQTCWIDDFTVKFTR